MSVLRRNGAGRACWKGTSGRRSSARACPSSSRNSDGMRARPGSSNRPGSSRRRIRRASPKARSSSWCETRYRDGQSDTYFVPTRLAGGPEAERLTREAPGRIIARFNGPRGDRLLYDGMADPQVCQALLDAIADERVDARPSRARSARSAPPQFGEARGPSGVPLEVIRGKAEQSNTAVMFDHRLILKVVPSRRARHQPRLRDRPVPGRADPVRPRPQGRRLAGIPPSPRRADLAGDPAGAGPATRATAGSTPCTS